MACRYVVSGRVQGVGFRYFVVREARALGLSGWVRNLVDGAVEIVVRGDDAAVGVLEGRLWQGPPAARVTSVERGEIDAPRWDDFLVLPTPW
jgi:acylphosphatase